MQGLRRVLFAILVIGWFKAISVGISGFYGTSECAKRLVFKANDALGVFFFEPGGRRFESVRQRDFLKKFN
jgi:hypothetical protein